MRDPYYLNWYRVMNMECFPFLRLIKLSTDYPRHQFDPLGLVLTMGPSLGGTRTSLWVEFSGGAFLPPPWRMSARFKACSLGLWAAFILGTISIKNLKLLINQNKNKSYVNKKNIVTYFLIQNLKL